MSTRETFHFLAERLKGVFGKCKGPLSVGWYFLKLSHLAQMLYSPLPASKKV